MDRFPEIVRDAMAASGAHATCVPVKLSDGHGVESAWQAALFFSIAGPQSKDDRRILKQSDAPLPVGFEADLIEHAKAAVVVIRLEVFTRPDDPLVAEVLLAPGHSKIQFDSCKLLTQQPWLNFFFGDSAHWVINAQRIALAPEHREVFEEILDDATRHDTLVRMTSSYDALAALAEVASHYEMREGVERTEYEVSRSDAQSNSGS